MKLISTPFALVIVISTSVANSQSLPPKGSWQSIALTCQIAGGNLCASQVLGGVQMLEQEKKICPDHDISASEAWEITNDYYEQHSDRRHMSGGLAPWVYEAATAKFRCTT